MEKNMDNNKVYSDITSYIKQYYKGTEVRKNQSFDEDWHFHAGEQTEASEKGFDDLSWQILSVSHDYSIEGGFAEEHRSSWTGGWVQTGIVWYRKHFNLQEDIKDKKVTILFDGVSMNSQVWINGRYLGQHPYAFTPFYYDITPFIMTGENEENVLSVRADTSLQPFSRFYHGTGIYRHVWMITTNMPYIEQYGIAAETIRLCEEQAEVTVTTKVRMDQYPETVWNAFGMESVNKEVQKTCTLITSVIDMEGRITAEVKNEYIIPNFSWQQ